MIAFNLIMLILLTAFVQTKAANDNTELTLEIIGGNLSVDATSTATFAGVNFSFTGENSTGNALGDITMEDLRGTGAGWTVDITGEDWDNGTTTMDYDGDGSATGQLSLDIPTSGNVSANPNGDDTTGISMGADDSFDSGTDTINFMTASNGNGSGAYTITGLTAAQYIPPNQDAGTYNMTLTLTAS